MSIQNVQPSARGKKKPPTVEDGPGSGFKRTKRWVDFTFGYGGDAPMATGLAGETAAIAGPTVAPGSAGQGQVLPENITSILENPQDFDETAPIARPDVPELSEGGVTPEIYDNSVLGGFLKVMDNIVPDDLGGMMRGESGWLSKLPGYEQTAGAVAGAVLGGGAQVIDALNWGSDQMNHLGSALVSWLPGGIQTLDWEQAQDVSFGQAFVASMGATAGRLERGEAEVGDWMMLPFSLISLGAAQLDSDNIAQDADFSVLNQEQMQQAFGSGVGMVATGGLDSAWMVAADPLILLGGASTVARLGAKGTKFGGLTNQALKKVEQVNRFRDELGQNALVIARYNGDIDAARASGQITAEGENLIAALQGDAVDLTNHVWVTGENASRAKTIIGFLAETKVTEAEKAADIIGALTGHAPSWRNLRDVWNDSDLYDRLSLANGVDNTIPPRSPQLDEIAKQNGGIYPISKAEADYGDSLFDQAKAFNDEAKKLSDEKFMEFEKDFGTNLKYTDEPVEEALTGQMIKRGGARLSPNMVRAANAWRRGKSRSQFGTAKKPTTVNAAVSGNGHYVYDFIEKTSASRPLTVVRWVGQGTPNGIIYTKGKDGERGTRELSNWLRKSPLDPDTSAQFLNRFVGAKTEAERGLILREIEEASVAVMAQRNGMNVENAMQMFNAYARKRQSVLDNARKTKNLFYRDPDTGEMVTLPSFYAEVDAAIPMLDTKLFEKVIKQNSVLGKVKLGTNEAAAAMDVVNTVWKVSVLLRLGYTQRNIVEGFLRSAAVIGLAATNPKAIINLPVNIRWYIGTKRGLRSARKIEKELNLSLENLQQARKMISDSLDEKGVVKADSLENLSQAQRNEIEQLKKIDELSDQLRSAIEVVKYKNSKRRKTGVGANQVAPGVYLAGAFDGSEGEIARLISSADRTQRNTILGAAQRKIDEYGDLEGFKEIDPSTLSAKQFDEYWAYYAERINRRYMADPFGKMLIADMPIEQLRAWFKTPEGKAYFEQIQATGGRTPRFQDVDEYISKMVQRMEYEVPRDSKLRELAQKGERLTPGEVAAAMSGEDLPIITGILTDEAPNTVLGWMKKGFNFGIEESMRWLGSIPETNLLRHPFYNTIYKARQKELYELAVNQGQDIGSPLVKARINNSAHADALRATNETMYTIQELSNTAVLLRWISPFFPAWENSMRTWGRLVYESPALLGVGNILWNIPNNLGWVVNEQGEKVENSNFLRDEGNYIVWPEPIAEIMRKDFGPFTPGEAVMTRQSGLNVVFPGGEWWFAGVGPMTQIPTALILRGKPEDQEIIKQAIGENLYRQIVPNGNPNTDLVDAMMPTVLRRVKQMWAGESSDSAYLTLKNTMLEDAYITAQLEGRALTEKDYRELDDKVNKFWSWQIGSAATSFTSANAYVSPYKLQRDEWSKLIDDQSLSYQEKLNRFMAKFDGSEAFLAITRSGSQNETGLQPNLKTWKRIVSFPDIVDQLYTIDPALVGMFGNMGSFDDPFSYAVYGEYSATSVGGRKPIRSQMTPRELARKNEIADGWRQWNLLKDAAEQRATDLGLSSLQVDAAKGLRDQLKAAEDALSQQYPAWGIEKESYEANWPKFVQGARIMVQNADLIDEDSTIKALRDWLAVRETIVAKLATTDNDAARKNIKQMGYAAAYALRQSDIGFADLFDQYLSYDDFREI